MSQGGKKEKKTYENCDHLSIIIRDAAVSVSKQTTQGRQNGRGEQSKEVRGTEMKTIKIE